MLPDIMPFSSKYFFHNSGPGEPVLARVLQRVFAKRSVYQVKRKFPLSLKNLTASQFPFPLVPESE